MSNINQILNSALLEDYSNDTAQPNFDKVKAAKESQEMKDERTRETNRMKQPKLTNADDNAGPWTNTWSDKLERLKNQFPNAGKYSAATLAALGAGIGAVALAKKLRAKKAAVKEAPKK